MLPYIPAFSAVVTLIILGWAANLITGRRALPDMILVSLAGGACGTFLGSRVFGVTELNEFWLIAWASAAAVASLLVYFLFRNKR